MIGGAVGGVVGKTDPGRRKPPWRKQIDGNGRSNKKSRRAKKTLLDVTLSDESQKFTYKSPQHWLRCSKYFLSHQAMESVKIVGEPSEAGTKGGTKATARDETRGQTSCREGAEGERTPGDCPKMSQCLKMKTKGILQFSKEDSIVTQ